MESDQIEFELESHAYCTEVTLNDVILLFTDKVLDHYTVGGWNCFQYSDVRRVWHGI